MKLITHGHYVITTHLKVSFILLLYKWLCITQLIWNDVSSISYFWCLFAGIFIYNSHISCSSTNIILCSVWTLNKSWHSNKQQNHCSKSSVNNEINWNHQMQMTTINLFRNAYKFRELARRWCIKINIWFFSYNRIIIYVF